MIAENRDQSSMGRGSRTSPPFRRGPPDDRIKTSRRGCKTRFVIP
jgi:hypothetical protein